MYTVIVDPVDPALRPQPDQAVGSEAINRSQQLKPRPSLNALLHTRTYDIMGRQICAEHNPLNIPVYPNGIRISITRDKAGRIIHRAMKIKVR